MAAAELEFADLQSSLAIKHRFQQEDSFTFWESSDYKNKLTLLRHEAFKVLAVFGTIHI